MDESKVDNWMCVDCNVMEVSIDVWNQKEETINQLMKDLEEAKKRISDLEGENNVLKDILREEEGHTNSWSSVVKKGATTHKIKSKSVVSNNSVSAKTTNNSVSIRIMGDSMIRYSAEECRKRGAAVDCFPGIRAEQLTRKIEDMKQGGQEEVVLLNVGTNNVKSSRSADHIMGDIWDLAGAAKNKFKRAKIIVSGLIRRKDTPIAYIDSINQCIDWACERLDLGFFDPNCWLDWNDLGRDGVHLNRKGTKKMSDLLCNVIQHFCNQGN